MEFMLKEALSKKMTAVRKLCSGLLFALVIVSMIFAIRVPAEHSYIGTVIFNYFHLPFSIFWCAGILLLSHYGCLYLCKKYNFLNMAIWEQRIFSFLVLFVIASTALYGFGV